MNFRSGGSTAFLICILALLVVCAAVVSFFFFYRNENLDPLGVSPSNQEIPKKAINIEPSTTPIEIQDKAGIKFKCIPNLCIENGEVSYTGENGEKTVVARNIVDSENPVEDSSYVFAEISPNKKFISLGSIGWENQSLEVYEIATGKTHLADARGADFGFWMNDNRLLVLGECGMGIDCGTFMSKSSDEPWKMEQIGDSISYGRTSVVKEAE